jgi:ABC-type polar amino acid transport system ATPase subunit
VIRHRRGHKVFDGPRLAVARERQEPVADGTAIDPDGTDLDAIRAEIGIVFQQFNLFPHLSVRDNLLLAPRLVRGRPRSKIAAEAGALLHEVDLGDKADRFQSCLSGGEQQRTAIARTLCMKPKVMLFDEPISALDPERIFGDPREPSQPRIPAYSTWTTRWRTLRNPARPARFRRSTRCSLDELSAAQLLT